MALVQKSRIGHNLKRGLSCIFMGRRSYRKVVELSTWTCTTFNMHMYNFGHDHVYLWAWSCWTLGMLHVKLSTWTCTTFNMVMPKDVHDHAQLSTCFLIGKLNFPNLALTDFLEFFTSKFVFTDFWGIFHFWIWNLPVWLESHHAENFWGR